MKIFYLLAGTRRVTVGKGDAARVMNICMKYRYPYRDMTADGEKVSFVFTLFTSRRLEEKLDASGIPAEYGEARGLTASAVRLLHRPGLIAGFAAAVLITVFSLGTVWDVRVTGCEKLTPEKVEEVLASCGFGVGSPTAGFDADETELRALLACDELAWISVNLRGTVANVEVHERIPAPRKTEDPKPANVVASHGGTVTEIIAYNGLAEVRAGDEIKAGELLISGAYGERTHGLWFTRASGRVMARTLRVFTAEIPYAHGVKVYSGRVKSEKYLIFFTKTIKVFTNYGNLGASCDKIEERKWISVSGRRLPVMICTSELDEYTVETAYYTPDEALALARADVEAQIKKVVGNDGRIIETVEETEAGEGSLILTVRAVLEENVAETKEFEVVYK